MRRTLSQSLHPPNSGRRHGAHGARTVGARVRHDLVRLSGIGLATALLLAPAGCNRIESEPRHATATESDAAPGTPASTRPASTAPSADETTPADFRWPTTPDHPLLRLEIEGAGIEGTIEIELMPELAPETVRQIRILASEGFYDGTTFHRVIPDFMIQGGDPNSRDRNPRNDGLGGPGFTIVDEFTAAPFERGVVGMGNKGRVDSNGSQFFIMHADMRGLDGRYTVIGRVRSGMALVDAITRVEIDRYGRWGPKDRPIENVVMKRVRVREGMDARASDSSGPDPDEAPATNAPSPTGEADGDPSTAPRPAA